LIPRVMAIEAASPRQKCLPLNPRRNKARAVDAPAYHTDAFRCAALNLTPFVLESRRSCCFARLGPQGRRGGIVGCVPMTNL
jgi:hypothetical protein